MSEAASAGGDADPLERLFALRPETWLRRVPGRETLIVDGPEGRPAVLKRYRGGEARDWWHERLRGRPRSPGRREFECLVGLAELGLPVPRALGWFEEAGADTWRGRRRAARSCVLMERVPHDETLRQRIARGGPAAARRWREPLARLVAGLHGAGWYHRDLYLEHVVLRAGAAGEELVLLDVARARGQERPRRRWFVKDLAALELSAPAAVDPGTRLRFLASYLRRRGLRGPGELRRWAAAVGAKAARLRAHAPRHVDPAGARGDRGPGC